MAALLHVLDNWQQFSEAVEACDTQQGAVAALVELGLTETQAQHALDLQLRRLTKLAKHDMRQEIERAR